MFRSSRRLRLVGRLIGAAAAASIALLVLVSGVLAADPARPTTDRVLFAFGGDLTVPAGERAQVVTVTGGTATIAGTVDTLIVVDGTVDLAGARVGTVVSVGSPVHLLAGSTVTGDVLTLGSTVERAPGSTLGGGVVDMAPGIAAFGVAILPFLILLFAGVALAMVVAALMLAALAARQVRQAGDLIRHETLPVIGVGLIGLFAPMILIALLFATIVGAPLALGILLGLWPLVAFVGYLVAAITFGEWIVARWSPRERERPYAAAIVGTLVLQVAGLIPLVTAIASLLGYGAVLILAWRVLTTRAPRVGGVGSPTPAPVVG
jgi:hypothetical protein